MSPSIRLQDGVYYFREDLIVSVWAEKSSGHPNGDRWPIWMRDRFGHSHSPGWCDNEDAALELAWEIAVATGVVAIDDTHHQPSFLERDR